MEKISIARRHRENKATLFPIKTDPPESHQESATETFQLPLLASLITEEANTIQKEKKRFMVEITSGLEKPLKLTVSIQPLNSESTIKRACYSHGGSQNPAHFEKYPLSTTAAG